PHREYGPPDHLAAGQCSAGGLREHRPSFGRRRGGPEQTPASKTRGCHGYLERRVLTNGEEHDIERLRPPQPADGGVISRQASRTPLNCSMKMGATTVAVRPLEEAWPQLAWTSQSDRRTTSAPTLRGKLLTELHLKTDADRATLCRFVDTHTIDGY